MAAEILPKCLEEEDVLHEMALKLAANPPLYITVAYLLRIARSVIIDHLHNAPYVTKRKSWAK